jgi:hypothetical protein
LTRNISLTGIALPLEMREVLEKGGIVPLLKEMFKEEDS